MALIILLSLFALIALVGIVGTVIQTMTDGYGPIATRAHFRRLP